MANIDSMNVGGQKSMIEDAAGRNMQSDAYDGTKIYSKEDICIYDNKLYEANQDITTAEVFNKAHWTESTLGSILERHRDSISGLDSIFFDGAGAHNSIYRGKNLGTSVTSVQYDEIDAGTFKDLYIGDYWEINGITYRIAAFDYYINSGDTVLLTTHHIVLVPDKTQTYGVMNNTVSTSTGYVGSDMYKTNLNETKSLIRNSFGSSHILTYRNWFSSASSSGIPSSGSWYDTDINLMSEQQVYGSNLFSPTTTPEHGIPKKYTPDKTQFPLFLFEPKLLSCGTDYYLRDIIDSSHYAYIGYDGNASAGSTNVSRMIRPYFCIKK